MRVLALAFCFVYALLGAAQAKDKQEYRSTPLAEAFGTMADVTGLRLSPDGTKVSFLAAMPGVEFRVAMVFDFTTGKSHLIMAGKEDKFDLRWCAWANNERILCGLYGLYTEGFYYFPITRLVAVNADGRKMKVLLQRKLENEYTQFQDDIVDWLVDDPQHVLITVPSTYSTKVGKLDVYDGSVGSETVDRRDVRTWMSDGRGEPRLYFYYSGEAQRKVKWYVKETVKSSWSILHERDRDDVDDRFVPVGFGETESDLLVFHPQDGRQALWRVDLADGRKETLLFAHREVDANGVVTLGKHSRAVAVSYITDRPHYYFFDPHIKRTHGRVQALFPEKTVTVFDESWDQRYYLVFVGSDRDPGAYYRLDLKGNQLAAIAPAFPKLKGRSLRPMEAIRYKARDGVEVPGYLTLPRDDASNVPTVILPHGGPHSRDYWGFDFIAQYLAAKGYAVLQPNYRGSGGYGEEWRGDSGFREWRKAMGDITDGAKHLIAEGIADPNRVCIAGWSYGGYAALMSGAEEPGLYKCLVSIAGVTDPWDLIKARRIFISRQEEREFIGMGEEVIKQGSPQERVAEIQAPVLLFHGEKDINVPENQSARMFSALQSAGKQAEYIEYKDAEHSILRDRYRIDMLARIGAFLERHIGAGEGSGGDH